MFWKSTAWSWDEAAGHDDDDGGYLLAAELRRTPDSAPDTDLNLRRTPDSAPDTDLNLRRTPDSAPDTDLNLRRTPDSAPDTDLNLRTNQSTSSSTATGLGDLVDPGLTTSRPLSFSPTEPGLCDFMDPGLTTEPNYTGTNQRPAAQHGSRKQEVTVSIVRGKDGFGFTICSDCPVRVQAVDPGGPAQQADLHQGDSILQLNGLPVETWKCVDLAHTIRSCPSQIVLVVWRGLPEIRSGCDALLRPQTQATGRKLLPHPAHSKHGRHRRGQGSGVRSSLGALGSLWRDRKEEDQNLENLEDQNLEDCRPPTTLKGTRVTSSNGDNYIILSPVDPGGQLLQPVYHDRNGTIGRLYQTHPSRGQNLLHDSRPASSRQLFTSHATTLTPAPPSTSTSPSPPGNYGNYQNCTIVQSHLPCSGYGTYVTLAPKTLIFPVFVQPLDLCSPDRTLLLSEEMILHQADLLPAKVTVLIYTDLLLLTREDEAGHCNVLQSPLYLNTLQLREVAVEPLHLYLLQNSHSCCRCLFSLEAFSMEQKLRVSLCLHDNIQQQLVATETGHSQQLSDLPSDFGLLSLRQSDLLYRTSSPYSSLCDSLRPPSPSTYSPSSPFSSSPAPPPFSSLPSNTSSSPPARTFTSLSSQRSWKERGGREEEEERQQGEGESASETSESIGGRGLLLSPAPSIMKEEESDEEEEEEDGGGVFSSSFRVAGSLRRSLSEGSLLQEARSSRFLSDSTIHRLTRPPSFHPHTGPAPRPPSPHTLRKQLTGEGGEGGEGGSLHHMLLLLHGPKSSESRNLQLKKKTKILAEDVRSRLPFLQRRKNSSCFHGNSLEKALRNNRPGAAEVQRWAESLEALLTNQYGVAVFRHFLRSEFSEENLDFWLAVERFRRTRPLGKMAARAAKIYDEFISTTAARQVNVDSSVRELTNHSLRLCVSPASFQRAQQQVFGLMETDSYPRFLKSRLYAQLANQSSAPGSANQSAAAQQLANQNM